LRLKAQFEGRIYNIQALHVGDLSFTRMRLIAELLRCLKLYASDVGQMVLLPSYLIT
jgi:hypothetical protein